MIYGHGMDDWFLSPDRSKENPVGKGKAKLFGKPAELEVAGIYDDFFFFFFFLAESYSGNENFQREE